MVNVNLDSNAGSSGAGAPAAGSYLEIEVVEATPHSLIGVPIVGRLPVSI